MVFEMEPLHYLITKVGLLSKKVNTSNSYYALFNLNNNFLKIIFTFKKNINLKPVDAAYITKSRLQIDNFKKPVTNVAELEILLFLSFSGNTESEMTNTIHYANQLFMDNTTQVVIACLIL